MQSVCYVSFYTAGTKYEQEAEQLQQTLDTFGLPYIIQEVPNVGDWCRNCARKASFVRDVLKGLNGSPLVWLDADARVVRQPVLFDDLDCDFAAHWLAGGELLSGTTYWSGSENSQRLASNWADLAYRHPDVWDQQLLQRAIEESQPVQIKQLPPEYTWICAVDGAMDVSETHYGRREPVIVHRQASRKLRNAL